MTKPPKLPPRLPTQLNGHAQKFKTPRLTPSEPADELQKAASPGQPLAHGTEDPSFVQSAADVSGADPDAQGLFERTKKPAQQTAWEKERPDEQQWNAPEEKPVHPGPELHKERDIVQTHSPGGVGQRPATAEPQSAGDEPLDGNAAQVAHLFQQLRQASKLGPHDLSAQLQVSPEVISVLEHGRLGQLPPWQEIERILRSYASVIGLDPLPMIVRLSDLLYAPVAKQQYVQASPSFAAPHMSGHQETDHDVRTQNTEPPPGPRPQQPMPPNTLPATDPVVPDNPLAQTAFNHAPQPASHGDLAPGSYAHMAPEMTADARAPHDLHMTAATVPQGHAAPGVVTQRGEPSSLATRALTSLILLVILVLGLSLVWPELQHPLVLGGHDESSMEALLRHVKAGRELFR